MGLKDPERHEDIEERFHALKPIFENVCCYKKQLPFFHVVLKVRDEAALVE